MSKRTIRPMTCKYCGAQWTVSGPDADLYLSCCGPCWEDDRPGMARYERMAAMMGATWAIDHMAPR